MTDTADTKAPTKVKWTLRDTQVVIPVLGFLVFSVWTISENFEIKINGTMALLFLLVGFMDLRKICNIAMLLVIAIDAFSLPVPKPYKLAASAVTLVLLIIDFVKNRKQKSQG